MCIVFSLIFIQILSVFAVFMCCCVLGVYLLLKGIVQRDVRGVESRLKRSALMNYLVALVYFFRLKGHSCERSKKPVSAS